MFKTINIFKITLLTLLLFSTFFVSAVDKLTAQQLKKSLAFFEKKCNEPEIKKIYKDENKRPNRLLLIDSTDLLSEAQIEYLRDNYISGVNWRNAGEIMSIVILDNQPISQLNHITMCSPLPLDKVGFFNAKGKVKSEIKLYKLTLATKFEEMVRNAKAAKETRLIETLYALYTNERFNFTKGDRRLLITSDLMQNSPEVKLMSQPSFEQTLQKNSAWFKISKLRLKKTDVVELYYFQTKCKVNLNTLRWWQNYFKNEGVELNKRFFFKAENGASDIPCASGKIDTPGPIIDNDPTNGQGWTGSSFDL